MTSALASLIGNAAGHLLAAGYLTAGPVLVVIVGAIPAMVLVALAHLAALLGEPISIEDEEEPSTGSASSESAEPADLERDTRTLIVELIGGQPRTVGELAHLTGKARSTVNGHLAALIKNGVILRHRDKRYLPAHRPPVFPTDDDITDGGESDHAD